MTANRRTLLKKIIIFIGLLILVLCGIYYKTSALCYAKSYWNLIENFPPEQRDVDDVMSMIYFKVTNDPTFNEIRKDYYQNIELKNYKILQTEKIDKDLYKFDMVRDLVIRNNIVEETDHFYVIRINNRWKIIFGEHNIPDRYLKKYPQLSRNSNKDILFLPGEFSQ